MTAYELSELKIEVNELIDWLNNKVRNASSDKIELNDVIGATGGTITLTEYQINSNIVNVLSQCLEAIDGALKAYDK